MLALAPGLRAEPAAPPQIPRDGWKDCAFNDRPIGCRDEITPGGFRLLWRDGPRMTYTLLPKPPGATEVVYRDRLGGLWRQELLPQGNRVLTHSSNGNSNRGSIGSLYNLGGLGGDSLNFSLLLLHRFGLLQLFRLSVWQLPQ